MSYSSGVAIEVKIASRPAGAVYNIYQLVNYWPAIGDTNTQDDNSYHTKFYFSDMPECNPLPLNSLESR